MITPLHDLAKALQAPLVKVTDVARVLNVSRTSVRALTESGELKTVDLAPEKSRRKRKRVHRRITRESLEAFYKKRMHQDLDIALRTHFSK